MSEIYRPGPNARPDTLVVSYYPLAGNDTNTGPRYQQEAELTGYDILGITRPGSDTVNRSYWQRVAFAPENFDKRWQLYADDLDSQTRDYDFVIVRGQSTGSFPALNIVKNNLVRATHLVLEDGINLRTKRGGQPKGPIGSRLDWLRAMIEEKHADRGLPDPEWQKPIGAPTDDGLKKFKTELYHWSPLWRSRYSRDSALEIVATRPELPVYFAFLGHTATATVDQVVDYCQEIKAAKSERALACPQAAEVKTSLFSDAWHDWLEYPQFGANNLRIARSMETPVR